MRADEKRNELKHYKMLKGALGYFLENIMEWRWMSGKEMGKFCL